MAYSLLIVLMFVALIVIAISHAKEAFKQGYKRGQEKTLDNFETNNIFKISDNISPVVIRMGFNFTQEQTKALVQIAGKSQEKLHEAIFEEFNLRVAPVLIEDLIKANLIYREISLDNNGGFRVEYGLVVCDNKNNFYKQMYYSDNYETHKRQGN